MTEPPAAAVPGRRIVFFFPYWDVSGVPMLFARMAAHLADAGCPVSVVDYRNGATERLLGGHPRVEVREFQDGRPCPIGPDEVLVMQSIIPCTMRPELHPAPQTGLFFWTLYPGNLIQTVFPARSIRQLQLRSQGFHRILNWLIDPWQTYRLKSFVESAAAAGGLAFMDGENLTITSRRTGATIAAPIMVPVPGGVPQGNRWRSARRPGAALVAGWLGRLADFKVHSLIHAAQTCLRAAASQGRRLELHIVGDGSDAALVREALTGLDGLRICWRGTIAGPDLDRHLAEDIDLLFAMGTSALEGARMGTPTVLLDISYQPVPDDYRYRWLHHTTQCNLGEIITVRHRECGNRSLDAMVAEVLAAPYAVSDAAYAYFVTHHAISTVADRFRAVIGTCSYTWGDLDPALLRKGVVRRGYEWGRRILGSLRRGRQQA